MEKIEIEKILLKYLTGQGYIAAEDITKISADLEVLLEAAPRPKEITDQTSHLPDEVRVLMTHLEDVLPDDVWDRIDVKTWNAVSTLAVTTP